MRKLLSELADALRELEDLKNREKGEFLSNSHLVSSAKYNLLIAIEAEIDICNHIISRRRYRTPEDYADTFKVMGEVGAFKEEFLKNLIDMAKFRNRLVHLYPVRNNAPLLFSRVTLHNNSGGVKCPAVISNGVYWAID